MLLSIVSKFVNIEVDLNTHTFIVSTTFIVLALLTVYYLPLLLGGEKQRKYPFILGIATGVPKYQVTRNDLLSLAMRIPSWEGLHGKIERLIDNTRINTRYMAIADFAPSQLDGDDELLFGIQHSTTTTTSSDCDDDNNNSSYCNSNATANGDTSNRKSKSSSNTIKSGGFAVPIQVRMERFRRAAVPLVTEVCRRAMADSHAAPADIGKLVLVSSTGFLGPSLDCELIAELGLARSTERVQVGFMGCAAAMNGCRVAVDYAVTHPRRLALLVCIELSSLHATFKNESFSDPVIHSIFSDGCAACIIAARAPADIPRGTLCIVDDLAYLLEAAKDGICLSVNDDGISCTLSKHLPKYIAQNIGAYVDSLLGKQGLCRADMGFWAVHPGGTRIIQAVQEGLSLSDEQTSDSWTVLREYGNMLSPSVLFVLERVMRRHQQALDSGQRGYSAGVAFSFSPGVGVEGLMFRQIR